MSVKNHKTFKKYGAAQVSLSQHDVKCIKAFINNVR